MECFIKSVHFNVAWEWCWNACLCFVCHERFLYALCPSRHAMKPPLMFIIYCLTHFLFLTNNMRFTQNFHIFQTTTETCINTQTAAKHLCLCNILWSGFSARLLLLYVYLRRKRTFVSSPPPQHKHSHQMVILTATAVALSRSSCL